MLVHEIVQPYVVNKASPNLDTSITRGQLSLIPSVRQSQKHFRLSNYLVLKSCVGNTYDTNSAGKQKTTKTSNVFKKCNVYISKNCFN